ncbi:urease accessory protein [Kushneria sinocarnis]|uniref:Urease accessory protein UreD n=1 Tax=Kushneria sinocarnis TaxID=595502 RepID=A0A420X122_9GAMM|nr:urease accessory protein UreD [Kushneria sinocarnis]RKR07558.1 urease accessory protein [Kushneria sinocarnis]
MSEQAERQGSRAEGPADSGHRFDAARRWPASLELQFAPRGDRTRLVRSRHQGPLRVQRPFHPEGAPCHLYLLHPPGGLASGDALDMRIHVAAGAEALVTTPAATKLYRSDARGVAFEQHARLAVESGGVLEWLPQETIAFDGARGTQTTHIELAAGAATLGWEVLALGRPAGAQPYRHGMLEQRFRLERGGRVLWHERQPLDPRHPRFAGRWGQGGATVQATLWAVGLDAPEASVAALRETLVDEPPTCWAVTLRWEVLLLRYLGDDTRTAWRLCERAWQLLRPRLSGRPACAPRIWAT